MMLHLMVNLPTIKLADTGHYIKLFQQDLNGLALNYNGFSIDGVFNTKTRDVVKNFQDRFNLISDGLVGSSTWKLLLDNVKAIQHLLNTHGYHVGNPDGGFGPITSTALHHFQRDHRLYPSGIVDPRTRQRLFNPNQTDHFELRPTSQSLSSLNSHVASMARRFLELTRQAGMDVRIVLIIFIW